MTDGRLFRGGWRLEVKSTCRLFVRVTTDAAGREWRMASLVPGGHLRGIQGLEAAVIAWSKSGNASSMVIQRAEVAWRCNSGFHRAIGFSSSPQAIAILLRYSGERGGYGCSVPVRHLVSSADKYIILPAGWHQCDITIVCATLDHPHFSSPPMHHVPRQPVLLPPYPPQPRLRHRRLPSAGRHPH